jgi:CRISPR/Cas system-associated exonuclease Cas4 (RecB family)
VEGVLGVVVGVVTVAAATTAVAVESFVTLPIEFVAVVSMRMNLSTSVDVRVYVDPVAPEIVTHVVSSSWLVQRFH